MVRFLLERQALPTLREIAVSFSFASTTGAANYLRSLEKKGYLKRSLEKWSALRLTGVRLSLEFDDSPEGERAARLLEDVE